MSTDIRPCIVCGKRLKSRQTRYCGRSCAASANIAGKRGAESGRWKGGRQVLSSGYVRVWHPTKRYELEHRVVAAQMLDRPLERREQVHHINGVRDDNRPENLLVLGIREHAILHEEHHFRRANRWAFKYDACIDCGRTTIRHASHGRCRTCAAVWRIAHLAPGDPERKRNRHAARDARVLASRQ